MKSVALAFAVALFASSAARAQDAPALLEKYKCYACHADVAIKTGPAFVDMAARYRSNPKAVSKLTAVVRKGAHGSGPWHMPPHPQVSDADATKMVRYILSLK